MLYYTFVRQQSQIEKLNGKLDLKLTSTGIAFRALLDLLDLLERRDFLEDQGQWDLLELVESVEKLDQRYRRFFCRLITVWYKCKYVTTLHNRHNLWNYRALQESLDPKVPLVPQDPPRLLWMNYLMAPQITTLAPLLLLSSVKMRLFQTATPPPSCLWTLASWPPWRPSAAKLATWKAQMEAENTQQEPVMTLRDVIPWKRMVRVKTPVSAEPKLLEIIRDKYPVTLQCQKKWTKLSIIFMLTNFL